MINKYVCFISLLLSLSLTSLATGSLTAPVIQDLAWGKITIKHADNSEHVYRDAIISPTGSKEWDWSKTGTRHVPGVQIEDVREIAQEVDIIILTKGMEERLQVSQAELYLKRLGKKVYAEQTQKAYELYNKLVKSGKKVAALFHTTC